jgi:hypothetical protein
LLMLMKEEELDDGGRGRRSEVEEVEAYADK